MTYSGQLNTYSQTVPDKRMVTDRILMTNPLNILTYLRLGTDIEKFNMVNREGKMYEWLEDTYNATTETLASGLSSGTTTTTCTITTAALHQPGDVWLIDDEQVWTSAVSGTTLTITRGWGSTTAATHADASTMTLVSRARIDGDDADNSPDTEVTSGYNYTQILQRTIEVTRTKEKLAEYGVDSWVERMIDKRMDELLMLLNKIPFYGKRYEGTASAARYCGGFRTFITDNLTTVAGALEKSDIDTMLKDIYDDGGDPDLIICSPHIQTKINDFYEGFVTTDRVESIGGIKIKQLMNPISGRLIDILVDRANPTDEMWFLSSEYISFYPFDPFFYEPLSKTGDAMKGQVVGEYGLVVAHDKSHGLLSGFSTTS